MFRTASRLPRRTLFSATVAGTAVGLHEREKLSIYPSPTPDTVLVDSPSELEKQIGNVRRTAQDTYAGAHAHVQGWVSKWIGVEHAVENRVKSIVTPEEPLTPNLLYVGVATLTGSILARNRGLATRFLLPPFLLIASAQHFLPRTTGNLSDYLGSLEDAYFPTFAEKHEISKAHSAMTWERIKDATKNGRERINHGAVVVVDKVQELTGLKLKETIGLQKAKAEEVTRSTEAVAVNVEKKVEEAEKVEEKEAKDAKRLV
ncbi:unnamed protein product [Cyclocybe aegerita]|uniref:MICOS complex subunit n=1 Tax=Cyclocybe aegerita TaxID=1973307 RepID=A0A8S0VVM8_CYCAE|nr:unnamed protein product [Cyclocybe aegerita]